MITFNVRNLEVASSSLAWSNGSCLPFLFFLHREGMLHPGDVSPTSVFFSSVQIAFGLLMKLLQWTCFVYLLSIKLWSSSPDRDIKSKTVLRKTNALLSTASRAKSVDLEEGNDITKQRSVHE